MNRKRNVSYIKPEDPEFLKVIKRQAGYDDRNHKFDDLQNSENDFVSDEESEKPQVVVLEQGDLTAEEAEVCQQQIEKSESEIKADLTQRVIYKPNVDKVNKQRKDDKLKTNKVEKMKNRQLLSFAEDEDSS